MIPDGFYTIADFNKVLSKSLYDNNYFFYNSQTGLSNISERIYPIQFGTDATHHMNTIIFNYIPTSSQHIAEQFCTSWVYVNSSYPAHACLPKITIP